MRSWAVHCASHLSRPIGDLEMWTASVLEVLCCAHLNRPQPAEGIAVQALKAMSSVGVPLYITETGVADERDALREEMMTSYFQQVLPSCHTL